VVNPTEAKNIEVKKTLLVLGALRLWRQLKMDDVE
tara:strand:+ start:559 stop:663 length:105 start_codon:yes stop_codon:yes gene_type:complete